ncbi:replication restart DNA helicase PriA [Evansella caseinilytica]|uniref:Replication restart protein PriA n=1 Tax=Evansella caseinilytica TaxID=1503961 RepID=A0A1H3MCR7_9BACI|nr:primosomal protein N' [Evansella caseinilytica]SDY74373.1 replication restart DNA helicase PriA [Evansella caseinilytica]
MIARVIVDVTTNQTDRLFDYLIPAPFQAAIVPGVRVVVPFGPRKVQGFVIEVAKTSTIDAGKLKPVEQLVDIEPPLTRELLLLSEKVKESTLSFHNTALKVMLPAAMRAKYKKEAMIHPETAYELVAKEIKRYFTSAEAVLDWDELLKKAGDAEKRLLLKALKEKTILVLPKVGTQGKKKKQTLVHTVRSPEELAQLKAALPANAVKQQDVLQHFIDRPEPVPVAELLEAVRGSRSTVKALADKGILCLEEAEVWRDPYEGRHYERQASLPLMEEQRQALEPILQAIDGEYHRTFLLRGVTGSGKTEVYLQAIERTLAKGKEAIVLVPEISLTPQMVTRFKERFGSDVAVLHSALSMGEKYDEWRRIREKQVRVAVGARSAIFAPFENLGMIIIDEEHETSYKQEDAPRYHARDIAIERGEYYQCPVVLGSATPSLESFARARKGVYELLTMEKRVNDVQLPDVTITDMREELRNGNRSMFSAALIAAIKQRLQRQEQIVLFLNRRGYSTFVLCRDCGYVAECPHCDISLTYHRTTHSLQCHYCGYTETPPTRCPSCEGESIRFFGFGTQKVEEELKKILPDIQIIRMDVDTTRTKGAHEKLLDQFGRGEGDILLGTQMIAKGLDFPNITLVGVLAADAMLHLQDFRAAERTFQLLTQVSGRAGRHEKAGEVIIQTYSPDHYSIQDVKSHDYLSFFQKEMLLRKQAGYPPYFYVTLIHVSDTDLPKTIEVTKKITNYLRSKLSPATKIYGPAASAIPRIKDRYRYQCMIKYKVEPYLTKILHEVVQTYQGEMSRSDLSIVIDTNPYMML